MKQEPASRMNVMNKALHIRPGAAYWMDWKRETSEKAKPVKVSSKTNTEAALVSLPHPQRSTCG